MGPNYKRIISGYFIEFYFLITSIACIKSKSPPKAEVARSNRAGRANSV